MWPRLRTAGACWAYENHCKGYGWTHFDFSQPAQIFGEILARTTDSGLGVLFDTANNLALNDDPRAVLAQVGIGWPWSTPATSGGPASSSRWSSAPGLHPWPPFFGDLGRMGFDGWLSMEEASRTGEAAIWPGWRQCVGCCQGFLRTNQINKPPPATTKRGHTIHDQGDRAGVGSASRHGRHGWGWCGSW